MLAGLDLVEFDTLAHAQSSRWGHVEELLVIVCSMLDQLIRVTVQAHSRKKVQFGPAFAYPRPGASNGRVVRPADLARRMGAPSRKG